MGIDDHLAVIKGFHRERGEYAPPSTETELASYAERFGEPLPPELADLLTMTGGGPFFGLELLSLSRVIEVRREWDQVAAAMTEDDDADYVAYPADQVAKRYWQPGWVPFLNEDHGPHGFAIDTAPLASGRVGQIVNYGPDDYVRYVCAPSLAEFLARIASEVRAGRVEWRDGFGHFGGSEGGDLLELFATDPSPAELIQQAKEDRRRAREADRATREADRAAGEADRAAGAAGQAGGERARSGSAPDADRGPLRIELCADGGIKTWHSSTAPQHVDPRDVAQRWVRDAARRAQPIEIAGLLAEQPVAANVELLRAAAGDSPVTVTDAEPPPLQKGWTTLMWAAAHGRLDLVRDLIDQGADATFAPRSFGNLFRGTSAYELAMARGHIPVLQALRSAGVPNPVRSRPPGATEAIVLRTTSGTMPYQLAVVVIAIGLLLGIALQSWEATLTLALMGVAVALMGAVLNAVASGAGKIAVDGPRVWTQRNLGWRGPVDLRQVIAVGLQESQNPRSPSLLRLGNADHGFPVRQAAVRSGFEADQVAALTEQDAKVLTLYLSARFFRPGLERYIGSQLDQDRTTVSASAMRTLFPGQ